MPADPANARGPYTYNEVLPDLLTLQCDTMNSIDATFAAMEAAYSDDGKITSDEMPEILMHLHKAHAASADAHNIASLFDERKPDAARAAVQRRQKHEKQKKSRLQGKTP